MNQEDMWLLDEKYLGEKCEAFFTDLELLNSGTPLAYLIGSIPFLGCTIHLDSRPLIPRAETEFWVEKAIVAISDYVRNYKRKHPKHFTTKVRDSIPYFNQLGIVSLRVLDLCAGSGAIGVSVAKSVPAAQVDFAEIDPLHFPTIQKNIQTNLTKPFDISKGLVRSDLFEKISQDTIYDFILTNPPYINPAIDRAEASVKLHEPHLALYGGAEGMECIQKIIKQAPKHLTKNGQLWIEHEPEQVRDIALYAKQSDFLCSTHKDQYGTERYSILVLQ